MQLSVVLCAYNPKTSYLHRVLLSLRAQTLPTSQWEFILVDNNSSNGFEKEIDLNWHPNARIIAEKKQGLIHARIAGTKASSTDRIVTVDDDTLLAPGYLADALKAFEQFPDLGIMGGRSIAEFEQHPPDWIQHFQIILCIKDLGEQPIITQHLEKGPITHYPSNGPFLIAYRRQAFLEHFLPHFIANSTSQNLGRKGNSLASGEDNDIVLSIYKAGWKVGYFPELQFTHIIPANRMTKDYMARLVFGSNKTWIQVLALHGISPYPPIARWSLPLRKARAYVRLQAWKGPVQYIKWCGACGTFEGQASS